MYLACRGIGVRCVTRLAMVAAVVTMCAPAMAQNKKNSWEVFIYFGGFFGNDVPTATQFGEIQTYRTEPSFADIGDPSDPNNLAHVFTPNMGLVGGDGTGDPNYPLNTDQGSVFQNAPCVFNNFPLTGPGDPRAPFFDECDQDQESRYLYNASGIVTNGEIQTDDTEFSLGLRGGYNITRHWEVELDLGFGKQRLDLTQNLDPLLTASVNSLSDPRAADLARFYEFTWANVDYGSIVPAGAPQEHPSVISSRKANDPTYNIPMYYPVPVGFAGTPPPGETFEDVTGFVNRVFQDPTAWRNRGNQINIDYFSVSLSGVYNFNTKADSRVIPYLSAGVGSWIRNFDDPYDGGSTSYYLGGAGIRFFVNEIFSFRADARYISYMDDSFEITGSLNNFNLPDREAFGECERDQRNPAPPCSGTAGQPPPIEYAFPDLGGGGGNAEIRVDAELDDFYEIRIGFDVILGGK
ncbi:MAG: hypothetical protein ACREAA_06100 [Candidatus Polarisedimenticolia bacterium]